MGLVGLFAATEGVSYDLEVYRCLDPRASGSRAEGSVGSFLPGCPWGHGQISRGARVQSCRCRHCIEDMRTSEMQPFVFSRPFSRRLAGVGEGESGLRVSQSVLGICGVLGETKTMEDGKKELKEAKSQAPQSPWS